MTARSADAARVDDALAALADVLAGGARQTIVSRAAEAADLPAALERLREHMRSHQWPIGPAGRLDRLVTAFDRQARGDGFHILHDWDGIADRVNPDSIPVDMVGFIAQQRGAAPADARVLAMLVDYYFFYLLTLCSVRVWDATDPDAALDRLNALLGLLQGDAGSGQRFVGDAATLLLIVGSHFEPKEEGFDRLLARVRTLAARHQRRIALDHAASLGCHLRFGYEATYGRDLARLRHDNVVDYPWLSFSLACLLREWDAAAGDTDRAVLAEAVLLGLGADVEGFLGAAAPPALEALATEREEVRQLVHAHRADLVAAAERCRPTEGAYSPFSFYFNFCQNALKGIVVDALLYGEPSAVSLSDLLVSAPAGDDADGRHRLAVARMLTGYARANPDRIRGRFMPAIFYDAVLGRRAFRALVQRLDSL